jgi:hypothetical protein
MPTKILRLDPSSNGPLDPDPLEIVPNPEYQRMPPTKWSYGELTVAPSLANLAAMTGAFPPKAHLNIEKPIHNSNDLKVSYKIGILDGI